MSSALRSVAQPLTRSYWAYNGVYYATYAFMKTYFDNNGAIYRDGFVLFPSEAAAAQAIYDIENACDATSGTGAYPGGYTSDGPEIWKDFGHELKIGVVGGKSDYFTYRTLKYVANKASSTDIETGATDAVYYVLVDSQPSRAMKTTLDGYGEVYASRAY